MTYLTQVTLDFATAARLRLRTHDWHQAAWKAFPRGMASVNETFSRGSTRRDDSGCCSCLEPVRPDWCDSGHGAWATKPIPETYFRRTMYEFQLCAQSHQESLQDGRRRNYHQERPVAFR